MPRLKDICTISSGYSFRGRIADNEDGPYRVVQLSHVDWEAERIDWEGLPRVGGIEPGTHHLLRPGDILFAAKGSPHRALCLTEGEDAVAASTFFVLRVQRDDVLPAFVAWFLNTEPARAHLRGCSRGTSIRSVSKSCLGALPVPLPFLEQQHRIVQAVRLARQERALTGQLLAHRARLLEAACLRAASPHHETTNPRDSHYTR